jgi:hypothetical protein
VVSASICAGSLGSVATAATTLSERAAVADIGDTTRWRELPSSAYSARAGTAAYRPTTGGTPAMDA